MPHFAAFFALRPHGRECSFSALDDEEFFVIEGSGWRGRRELAPRCSATQLGASHARAWIDTPCRQSFVPPPPPPGVSAQTCFLVVTFCSDPSSRAIDV